MDNIEALTIINRISNIIVIPPEIKYIINEVNINVQKTQTFDTPLGCFILAEGGMGKTTICKAIMSKYKPTQKEVDGAIQQIIPAFYIEVPAPVTVKSLAGHMLSQFNDPIPTTGDTLQLTNRLCQCIQISQTKLIIFDEFHHLVDLKKTSKKLNQNVASWIKNLVNRTGITFCLVGLPEFKNIIENDTQLARRFPLTFNFKTLQYSPNLNGTLQKFLNQYQKNICENISITFENPLSDKLLSLQIFAATNGNISFISLLIKQTIFNVLKAEISKVTMEHFAEVWDTGITSYVTLIKRNPFRLNINSLCSELGWK